MTILDFNAASKKKEPAPGKEMKPVDKFNLETLSASLEPYRAKVEKIKQQALAHKVTDEKSNELAIDMGMQSKKLFKSLDGNRITIIKPYDTIVRGINKLVKPFKDTLGAVEKDLKTKIGRYQNEQRELAQRIAEKKAKEEAEERRIEAEKERQANIALQEKERQEAIARKKELDAQAEKGGVEKVEVLIPEVVEPEPVDIQVEVDTALSGPTRTKEGTASISRPWKHSLVDIDQVPDQFRIVSLDTAKIKQAIKNGVRVIPGLKIFEDSQVSFRAGAKGGKF